MKQGTHFKSVFDAQLAPSIATAAGEQFENLQRIMAANSNVKLAPSAPKPTI